MRPNEAKKRLAKRLKKDCGIPFAETVAHAIAEYVDSIQSDVTDDDIRSLKLLGDPDVNSSCWAFEEWLDRHGYAHGIDEHGEGIRKGGTVVFRGSAMAQERIINRVAKHAGITPHRLLTEIVDILKDIGVQDG